MPDQLDNRPAVDQKAGVEAVVEPIKAVGGLVGFGVGFMAAAGLVDHDVLVHAAVFAPLALAGIMGGQYLFRRTGGHGFRRVVLTVLVVLSVAILVRSLVP